MTNLTDTGNSVGGLDVADGPDVAGIEDIIDAMELCDEHEVPYDGLENIEDFIERLRLHFTKQRFSESRKKQIEKNMLLAGKDDANRRKKLTSVMTDMMSIIHKQGPNMVPRRDSQLVEGLLRTEGTSDNLADDCRAYIDDLETGECVMIVAGETSAGKSSVLNLLFEDDILPVFNNSSTSTITIIRYHRRKHARILYKSDKPDTEFDLDEEGLKKLHAIAFMKSASERENHNIKEVQVYLPLPLLQSGLVFVDTPGIGENEFLELELTNFIKNNTILGFMYIIKTDNAGGVQEDRLLGLLKIVLEMQRSDESSKHRHIKFDPKSALFVCNRVDLVEKTELDKVKANAIDKLSKCWPNFDESQVVFFSTEKALRDVNADNDYINDNYKQFLDNLKNLFISSLERRIKQSFKWIENVLKRTIHHLKTVVRRLDLSDMDLKDKSEIAREKLAKLRCKSESVLEELKAKLDVQSKEMCSELREYLLSEQCKNKLTREWSAGQLPTVDAGLGDWQWIRMRIHEAFYDRIIECVEDWNEDERKIESLEEELSFGMKIELQLLEEDLAEIEKQIHCDSSSASSDDLSNLSKNRMSRRRTLPRISQIRTKYLLSEPKMPLKLAGRIIKPFQMLMSPIKNKMKVNEYKDDPVKMAKKTAKDMYDQLLNDSNQSTSGLTHLAEYLLERPREYIEAVERQVPAMILANQLLVNRLEESIETERLHQAEYEEMMTSTEALKRALMEYGEGYIFVADFSRGELQIQQMPSEGGEAVSVAFNVTDFLRGSSGDLDVCRRRDIRGLWTVTYSGSLFRNSLERPVAIKVYLPSSGVEFTYAEVAKLRCLTRRGANIAEFLGIHNAETITPAFVYEGDLKSVRRSLSAFCNKRESVPEILIETACGLEYLHTKGLVHMELSQDTVTMDEAGNVQLTGACLPRFAKLPFDTERIDTGDFVYLAPEVLRGDKYEVFADVYSFGLFILELAQVEMPVVFREQRKMTLCDFIRTVDPEKMLNLEEVVEVFTNNTRALILNCLEIDKDNRPLMSEVIEYTSFIKNEKDALAKLPTRRSRARPIKRPSLDKAKELKGKYESSTYL
ncbi:uncharacterized protein LOC132739947 isoform X2 [Ruditapes philippinarum]|uniref:uncharacterized protein LOC132739947 isoform X2 n=1 Tax=Ruditapes philippinarum TaxID=129788 RepID=UPI00295C2660|nr:uncharacterized protein LOC132739947 isoform X2 [Ruditapes philippinarum]